jgi:hypothetical protein
MAQFIKQNLAPLIVILVLILAYFLLRNRPSSLSSIEEFNTLVNGGKPVVVEFFSNT